MTAPLCLLETMRAENGRIALLDRHLARLAAGAAHFGYRVPDDLRQRLADALASGAGVRGVRLRLGPEADLDIATWELADEPFRTVVLHPEPMAEAGGPLCTHKTTGRDHYRQRAAWAHAHGADEALLLNPSGEVVEGTRTSVWVERDGRLWTPSLAAGGLAGVMRAHVLGTRPDTGEATLAPDDLHTADALFLSNALRGWMPVRLVEPGP